jgi:sigma-B regulation protein RsbU (phosphoserine phosphatase)
MEVWGGSQIASSGVELAGLDAWIYSKPFGQAQRGGDVYYVSSCASGRISRLLLADVSGHGKSVASTAADLRLLMRRFVNRLDQKEFVRVLNEQFTTLSQQGTFSTAVVTTFFAPSRRLSLCNGDCLISYTDALIESCDCDGEMLGEKGLLRIVNLLGDVPAEKLIETVLREIAERFPDNLSADDVTLMVVRANGRLLHFSFREQLNAFGRFVKALFRSLRSSAERVPFPDAKLANIGGAIIPALGRRWRAPRALQK